MLKLDPLDFGKASKDGKVGTDTTIAWQYRDINGEQQHCSRTLRFTPLFPSTEKFKMSESIIMDASMRKVRSLVVETMVVTFGLCAKAVLVTRFVMFVHSTCRCGYWAKQDLQNLTLALTVTLRPSISSCQNQRKNFWSVEIGATCSPDFLQINYFAEVPTRRNTRPNPKPKLYDEKAKLIAVELKLNKFPHPDSVLSQRCKYGVITSQLHRP